MYFYGVFQTDVLIKFFIPFRPAKAITRKSFVPTKWDPGITEEGYRLARMKLFT